MEWIILFQRRGEGEENMVIMPSVAKLLVWIARSAHRCCYVSIRMVEDDQRRKRCGGRSAV